MDLLRSADNRHTVVYNVDKLKEEMRTDAVEALNGRDVPIGKYVEQYVDINHAMKEKTIYNIQALLNKILK
jgi:hypothetical protein